MASRFFIAILILISCLVLLPSRVSAESFNVELAAELPAVSPSSLAPSQSLSPYRAHFSRKVRSHSIALVRQGCELDKQGKHMQALQKFELASQVDPSYETALSNLVTACLVNGRLNQGLSAGTLFINRFPASQQGHEVNCMVNSMKLEWQRRILAQVHTGLTVGPDTSDYFAYQLVHKVRRWPAHLLPIRVFVASGKGVKGFRSSFRKDLLDSFQEWSDGCHGLISFVFVDDPQEASIDCEWIDDIHKFPAHSGIEGGETVPYYNNRGLARATIMLLTTPRSNRGKELDTAMRHVCLHEIGHSLGLMEHSDSPEDIMFYAFQGDDRTRPKLSGRDVMTLVRLYSCNLAEANGGERTTSSTDLELASRLSIAARPGALPPTEEKKVESSLPAKISVDRP